MMIAEIIYFKIDNPLLLSLSDYVSVMSSSTFIFFKMWFQHIVLIPLVKNS